MKTREEITISEPVTDTDWQQYYALRYQMLRQPWGQPPGTEKLPDDPAALHAILKSAAGEVLGVCRLHLQAPDTGQLRMMAVHPRLQGQGYGRWLVHFLEKKALALGARQMVLEAREEAVPFYEKLGYRVVKKSHLLFGSIQHYLMARPLDGASGNGRENAERGRV